MSQTAPNKATRRSRPPRPLAGRAKRRHAVARWVDERQAQLRYVFSTTELISLGLSTRALYAALERLQTAKRIIPVGRGHGLWAIVPLEHQTAGAPPVDWILSDLMTALDVPYYVGLRSAAAWYGATHHALQVLQVVTSKRLRPITLGRQRIRFVLKADTAATPVQPLLGGVTELLYSTPEATAIDLVKYRANAGGLNTVAGTLAQIVDKCTPNGMTGALDAAKNTPTAQRLGYLWSRLGADDLAASVASWLNDHPSRVVHLDETSAREGLEIDPTWKLIIDSPVDFSL